MFAFTFIMSFVFSILGLFELKGAIQEKEVPAIGFILCVLSTITWFIVGFIWPAVATSDVFVSVGYLWTGLAWVFLILSFTCVFYILKFSVKPRTPSLEVREEESQI